MVCGILHLEAGEVDAAFRQAQFQDLEHLLELEIHLRVQRDEKFLQLEARAGVLEIEPLARARGSPGPRRWPLRGH